MDLLEHEEMIYKQVDAINKSDLEKETKQSIWEATTKTLITIDKWVECGCKTFVLDKNLLNMFKLTDVPFDLRGLDIKFPFKSIKIESSEPLFWTNVTEDVNEDFLIRNNIKDHKIPVNCVVFSLFEEGAYKTRHGLPYEIKGSPYGKMIAVGLTKGLPGDLSIHANLDKTYQEILSTENPELVVGGKVIIETFEECDLQNLLNVILNTVLYVNSEHRNATSSKPHKSGWHRVDNDRSTSRKEAFIYLKAPKGQETAGTRSRTIDKRFWVRGHYRNQPCGLGLLERKLIWVMPFIKGPDSLPVTNKPYKI